jgi:hypothetical protein
MVKFGEIPQHHGDRIVIYGPGGIGKTTLSLMAPGPVAIFDLDDSLSILRKQLVSSGLDLEPRVVTVGNWQDLRDALHASGWDAIKTIVIDSATRAEELATDFVIKTVPHEKGTKIQRLEDYGWGKGYTHVYEMFLTLLGDLDQHVRAGRNIVLTSHDCTATVPNPRGEDWQRYEPRLQSPASGKGSIRLRVREWADHLLFVGYDLDVSKDGKARGSGSRTIYPTEQPFCMAKSRLLEDPMILDRYDSALWDIMFKETSNAVE